MIIIVQNVEPTDDWPVFPTLILLSDVMVSNHDMSECVLKTGVLSTYGGYKFSWKASLLINLEDKDFQLLLLLLLIIIMMYLQQDSGQLSKHISTQLGHPHNHCLQKIQRVGKCIFWLIFHNILALHLY